MLYSDIGANLGGLVGKIQENFETLYCTLTPPPGMLYCKFCQAPPPQKKPIKIAPICKADRGGGV